MVLPRFWRCARASAGESLNRTTLPPTTAVAYMISAYAKAASDTSDPRGCIPAGLRLIRPDETTQPDEQFLAARSLAIRRAAALTSHSDLGTRNRDVNDPVGERGRTRARGPGS